MNKREQAKIKKLLQMEQQNVIYKLNKISAGSSSESAKLGPGDDADIALSRITQEQLSRLGEREQHQLKQIQAALGRLEQNEYGICDSCGEDIAAARLEARPFSIYCISCKNAEELRARHYALLDEEENTWLEAD